MTDCCSTRLRRRHTVVWHVGVRVCPSTLTALPGSSLPSDSEESEEGALKKPVPQWARSYVLKETLHEQRKVDPDTVFRCPGGSTCDLEVRRAPRTTAYATRQHPCSGQSAATGGTLLLPCHWSRVRQPRWPSCRWCSTTASTSATPRTPGWPRSGTPASAPAAATGRPTAQTSAQGSRETGPRHAGPSPVTRSLSCLASKLQLRAIT